MKISPLLFLFVALFVSLGFGQKTEANYGRTLPENLFKNGRNEQKLPKQIRSVFQDKSGNYWFGTNGAGIYCYDSKTLRQYTVDDGLADNQCLSIQEDRLGNIWVESGNFSISKFDGAKFSTIVKKENSSFNIDSIWKSQIDELWFYGGNGVFRSNGTAMEYSPFETTGLSNNANAPFSLSSSSVYSLLKDKKDQVWFGTQAEGVCMFDGKKLSWFKEKGLAGPAVLAIFEDSKGNMWFGNNGAGVFLFDGSKIKNITQEAAVLGTKKNALDITERKSLTRPPEEFDFETWCISGHKECGDSLCVTLISAGASKDDVVCGVVQTTVPTLHAVDDPLITIAICGGLQIRRITAVIWFCQAECKTLCSIEETRHPVLLLFFSAEVAHHQNGWEVADNAAFILQVVVQPKTFCGEVFANDGHGEVACTLATKLFRQCES
jgi:hypothetical protein